MWIWEANANTNIVETSSIQCCRTKSVCRALWTVYWCVHCNFAVRMPAARGVKRTASKSSTTTSAAGPKNKKKRGGKHSKGINGELFSLHFCPTSMTCQTMMAGNASLVQKLRLALITFFNKHIVVILTLSIIKTYRVLYCYNYHYYFTNYVRPLFKVIDFEVSCYCSFHVNVNLPLYYVFHCHLIHD